MTIRWTDAAVRDFTQICDYRRAPQCCGCSPRGSIDSSRLDLLADFPEYGRTGRKPDTRELVFSGLPYLAVYRIHQDAVEIVRIFHGAQDWME
jgi:toxin ParE1/3/4